MHPLSLQALWETFRTKVAGRRFVQDVGVLTVANFVGAALSFVQGMLVARRLGPELYGIAALVMSYPALLFSFLDARSSAATVKYLSEFSARGESNRALAMCKLGYGVDVAVALLTFLLVAATSWWAGVRVVHMPDIAPLMLVYAAAFLPRALVGTSSAALSVFGHFQQLAWVELVTTTVRVTLVLGLVLSGWGVAGVIWGNAVGMAVSGIVLAVLAYPLILRAWGALRLSASWSDLRGRRREILRFLLFMDLNELLGLFVKQLDIMILGYFRGPQEAGYYKLAKSLAGVVGYLVGPLQSVTYPRLALLVGAGRQPDLKRLVGRVALWIGIPLGCLSFISIPIIPILVPMLLGEAFLPAILATQAFFAGSAVWLAFFWLRPTFMALGEARAWLLLSVLDIPIVLTGMFITASVWGYIGLAFWIMGSQIWGHGMFAGWLVWRIWRTTNTRAGQEAIS